MKLTLRSPFLWISATLLSGLMYFFAFHFFPQTFPIIHLSITMDLEQALHKADKLEELHHFTLSSAKASAGAAPDYQSAAMFNTDNTVKTFVELEAGGKDALIAMMEENLYMPYTWRVRHFKEHEKNETTFIFTPDGKPYGFVETLSENTPGAQLTESDARHIAETDAAQHWDIDFTHYKLVESSQKLEISGRLNHIFIYERANKKMGDGLYRLKIVISGDKMTELTHFVKIPEAFTRRYVEMRSANNTIAWAALIIMALLYLLGGCGVGLFYLIKTRWAIFKQPLLCALLLALLSFLVSVNQLPFLWMHYATAFSANGFLMQLFINLFIAFLAHTASLTMIMMTAEGLTRKAFGDHPQLWSLLQPNVSNSYAILGRTYGAYLLVGLNCAFVIGFYLFSTQYLQWWSPSEMLFDPNILATYVPWFSPIAQSLNAGIMEECLFRAIPLAGAALLGKQFGKKNWWIGATFILQAIVFGAAHANYPMQPSYARLVELLIPSFIWGALYLRFGLITTIITHSVYDIIWFSLPIFISHAPHALAYKIIIILISILPLLYVLYTRIQQGYWSEMTTSNTNAAWQAHPVTEKKENNIIHKTISSTLSSSAKKIMLALGIVGAMVWLWATPFMHDGVTITLNRNDAITTANEFLIQKNFIPTAPWRTLPLMFTHYKLIPYIGQQHTFIWKEGKKEVYHQLLGTYLHPAHWTIRYAQFNTDIIQRAEEHKVMLYNDKIWQYHHQLPESMPGAELTQEQARTIALTAIKDQFNLDAPNITEVSAIQAQLPARRDWAFTFSNPAAYSLPTGQARIVVTIAGENITDIARMIYVPEEWERAEQHKQNMLNIFVMMFILLFFFLIVLIIYLASKQQRTFIFSKRLFLILFGIMITLFTIDIINTWPNIIGSFNTSLPLNDQLFQMLTQLMMSSLIKALFYAGIISYVMHQKSTHHLPHHWSTTAIGIATGLLMTGILSVVHLFMNDQPLCPEYESLSCSIPLFTNIIGSLLHYMQLTIVFSLLYILVDTVWEKHHLLITSFAMLCGIMVVHLPSLDMIGLWVAIGAIVGLILLALYRSIIQYDYALITIATGSVTVLHLIQQGIFNAYPGALWNNAISAGFVAAISFAWYRYVSKN